MSWASAKRKEPKFITEPVTDSELSPVICIACGASYEGETESIPEICTACGAAIDLETQFAFSRAVDSFDYGQQLFMRISPRMRQRNPFSDMEMEVLRYYQQSYSSFFRSFEGELAESQRRMAIEIMASICMVQLQHQVISSIESAYWQSLLKELSMQKERIEVEEKIANPPGAFKGLIKLRWQLRRNQLNGALVELDHKIEKLEKAINFAQPPKVRRKELPSLES